MAVYICIPWIFESRKYADLQTICHYVILSKCTSPSHFAPANLPKVHLSLNTTCPQVHLYEIYFGNCLMQAWLPAAAKKQA